MPLVQLTTSPKRLIRVFPRRTKATPLDALARSPEGELLPFPRFVDEADEIHIDVTFELAEARLRQMVGIGMTPYAMLWEPETPSAERWRPAPEWHKFQRRWLRPAIIHAQERAA